MDSVSRKADDVTVSERFAAHIERLEGFRATKYRDIAGHWTIGFGHLIRDEENALMRDGLTLTREEALHILRKDVIDAEHAINTLVTVPLKQEQYDALVSFVFNVGAGRFRDSTLLQRLNAGHCCAVPDQLRRWKRAGGQVSAGLIARRAAEIALYVGEV